MESLALKDRLQRLGGRFSNPSITSAAANADPKLAELLARIARLKGRARLPHAGVTEATLAARLGGEIVAPGLILVERNYPLWHKLGRVSLVTLLHARGEMFPEDPRRCLFLDTETTGLAGGSGTLAFMIGIGRLQPSGSGGSVFTVRQYLICGFGAEGAMLDALAQEVNGDDCLVTFNGKSYDLPLLATRHRLLGRANPLTGLAHLDLLHPLRRIYGKQFADCRLKTLEEQVLGHRRDKDLPGSEAPKAWLDWLKRREMTMLAEVARHNRGDVLAMVGLCHCLRSREAAEQKAAA
ncbi:MAG: ribonuclease H-like domain-containing protein [Proteobacteria bacterium]|nr:ribonuclease H-like domain-containing protein [Pseudomonadota bacterium]